MISMRNFRRIFKSSSYFNGRKKTKQIMLVILVLLLTVSIVLTVPTTAKKTKTDILTQSTQTTTRSSDTVLWNKTYGAGSVFCVQQTTDGGYIFLSSNSSFLGGYPRLLLIKTDTSGNVLWNKMYGGEKSDLGYFLQQTSDGGYIIVGYTNSYGAGEEDVWLLKTDKNGDHEWNQTYGGEALEKGHFVQQTKNGGYIITGCTESFGIDNREDIWLIKTDENGDHEWNQTYGGVGEDLGECVRQITDGGYIVTGRLEPHSHGPSDLWLIKTDEKGNALWNKTYEIVGEDYGKCVEQTTDGGYIITGTHEQTIQGFNILLIKTDENGNAIWIKESNILHEDKGEYVHQTTDGGYIIIGATMLSGFEDFLLVKTDENGNILWNQTYGGTDNDYVSWGDETLDGGYVMGGSLTVGYLETRAWLIKVYVSPYIDNPDDITYEEGTTGHTITWHASDVNPLNYTITRGDIVVIQDSWNGGSITVSVDGLLVGNYIYICNVTDDYGNTISNIVTVTVTSTSEEDSNFLGGTLSLVLVAIVGALLVLGMILTKKKS